MQEIKLDEKNQLLMRFIDEHEMLTRFLINMIDRSTGGQPQVKCGRKRLKRGFIAVRRGIIEKFKEENSPQEGVI